MSEHLATSPAVFTIKLHIPVGEAARILTDIYGVAALSFEPSETQRKLEAAVTYRNRQYSIHDQELALRDRLIEQAALPPLDYTGTTEIDPATIPAVLAT